MSNIKEVNNALGLLNRGGKGSAIRNIWRDRPEKDISEGKKYNDKGEKLDQNMAPIKGRESLLHSLSVIHYANFNDAGNANSDFFGNPSDYYNGNETATGLRNPTGSAIVKTFGEGFVDHAMQYKEGDFLFPEGYGKIPNNYMITLRRFSNPCGDNLRNQLENPSRDVSRLISWIDGEDNTMENMFSFTLGYNWKEFKSEIQTIERGKTAFGNEKLNNIAGLFNSDGRYAKEKLQGQAATDFDPYSQHQDNYTWGPIDVIDSIITRDRGLKFEQNLTVKFKYKIRSYDGINTRAAFMDILGNILNMTYSKAPFWGGAVRFTGGGGFATPIGDFSKLRSGDTVGFLKSFMTDLKDTFTAPFAGGFMEGLQNLGKTLGGNSLSKLVGGGLDKLGRPEMFSLHSLLTAQNTGEWHLTVGNPFNPTMMIGNLVLEDSDISLEGPFTIDDVPSTIVLTCKLKHAMPRDKYAIQKMFNYGGSRYYGSDTDFAQKSYYRNRGAGSGSKNVTPIQTTNNTLNAEPVKATSTYIAGVYQEKFPAIKTA
jgi:hypothetical protein